MSVYQSDLAAIHDRAFGDHPRRAATRAIAELRRRGIREGRVVELGCGSGITSALFHAAGHAVWGVDPSPAMIELSRQRLPAESFEVRSAWDTEIPEAVAVTAIGEVLSYRSRPDERRALEPLFARVHAALAPGGLFVLDLATPARSAGGEHRHVVEDDWALLLDFDNDGTMLTRRITTFLRSEGAARFRRSHERHHLELYFSDHVVEALAAAGFRTERLDRYAPDARFPAGLVAFVAEKPG